MFPDKRLHSDFQKGVLGINPLQHARYSGAATFQEMIKKAKPSF